MKILNIAPYLVAVGALVYAGVATTNAQSVTDTNCSPEARAEFRAEHMAQRERMDELIQSGDYEAWKEQIESSDRPNAESLLSTINADNFDQFVKMHQLMKDGDFAAADSIRQELGLPNPPQGHHGLKDGMQRGANR